MVNWHDPALLLKDYFSLVKLGHAIAGVYIWDTVITIGFELDVLRGKRPYRWTIWLYLGTRYTGLLAFVFFFINIDGARVPCQLTIVTNWAMGYASLAFASLIIVLRVIAIWNRNIIVSLISIGVWLASLALNIRDLTLLETTYNPIMNTCIILDTHRGLLNATGVLAVDATLLFTMLIGLLLHPHRNSTGMWKFLYQQCIIWILLAMVAEIPLVVFLALNLNDAWNVMFVAPTAAILAICATRMYRSLSDRGSFTQYVSSDLPQFSSGNSIPPVLFRGTTIHLSSVTHSDATRSASEAPVFLPAEQVHVGFIPGRSISSLAHDDMQDLAKSAGYRYQTA